MSRKGRRGKRQSSQIVEQPMNPFAIQHGDYGYEPMPVTAGELGEERHGNVRVFRNRGGTAVERWLASDSLTKGQTEAIELFARASRLAQAFYSPTELRRVTMNWSLTSSIRGISGEQWIHTQTDAKETLEHLDEQVFRRMPPHYVEAWRNVVLFDEPTGKVGRSLGYSDRDAEAKAKTICLFIADMIATVLRLG